MRRALTLFLILFLCDFASAQARLTTAEAKAHIGERATICGNAVGVHYAGTRRGRPTFINLDKPYPGQIFTIVIWGNDRFKFGYPQSAYADKPLCVTGFVTSYRGVPEMIVSDPAAISMP